MRLWIPSATKETSRFPRPPQNGCEKCGWELATDVWNV